MKYKRCFDDQEISTKNVKYSGKLLPAWICLRCLWWDLFPKTRTTMVSESIVTVIYGTRNYVKQMQYAQLLCLFHNRSILKCGVNDTT